MLPKILILFNQIYLAYSKCNNLPIHRIRNKFEIKPNVEKIIMVVTGV